MRPGGGGVITYGESWMELLGGSSVTVIRLLGASSLVSRHLGCGNYMDRCFRFTLHYRNAFAHRGRGFVALRQALSPPSGENSFR